MIRRLSLFLAFVALLVSACEPAPSPTTSTGPVVLASTSYLADMARNVAGQRSEVTSLVPTGADPHEYQASPSDVQKIAQSTVLIMNGLDYERFLQPLLDNAGGERLVIIATDGTEPLRMEGQRGETTADPHMWLDPTRVIHYVENIREGLSKADPEGAQIYQANGGVYIQQLKQLDSWIMEQVSSIPPERRLLVTNHEAMGYFADHYDFKIVSTIIPNISTEAGTSAKELVAVIEQVKALQIPAIFLGELENPDLANQVASETGAIVVSDLYLETLTQGPPAATYIDMMKHNVTRIVESLKQPKSSALPIVSR